MLLIAILFVILAALVWLAYAVYRAARKWGVAGFLFASAVISILGASGVMAERLFGPRWSWNFANHGAGYAGGALVQAIIFVLAALHSGTRGQRSRR